MVPAELNVAKATEPTLAEAPPPVDPLGGSSVTGLSGLTEIMQHEPVPESPADASEPPLQAKLTQPKPGRGAPKPFSPKTRRTAIFIIGILALVVAVAGLLVFLVASGNPEVPNYEFDIDRLPGDSDIDSGQVD